jgi:hypothetical protein
LLASLHAARAGDVGITYLKTIGQSSPHLPLVTGGGRISVDAEGNVYAGTPGANSYLQKISPSGRLIWRDDYTHCAYTGTAVDDEYVYGCGIGYYGYRHLLRRKKVSGVLAPGWNFVWKKPEDVVDGVRGFQSPSALLVDEQYLYVLDGGNGEVRRLDKASGAEQPFATPITIAGAVDMAFSSSGGLLVLANAPTTPASGSVSAFDRVSGTSLNSKLIGGLGVCAAIAVQPKTGAIFVGEGGAPATPINKVRIFTTDGKDPEGGLWSNGFSHRMGWLALITHFSPTFEPDKVFLGGGNGLAVDDELNVTVGGNYKLSWDGDLLWTSGLTNTAPQKFPTTINNWTLWPILADAQRAVIISIHGSSIYALDAKTGELANQGFALPMKPGEIFPARAGTDIFLLGGGKVFRTNADLAPLQEVFTVPPEVAQKGLTGLAVATDGSTLFISAGKGDAARVYAYRKGAQLWECAAGQVLLCHKNILLTTFATGAGVLTIDAETGDLSGSFGRSAIADRPALTAIYGAAMGTKDGTDYLFIACQSRILIYRMVVAP